MEQNQVSKKDERELRQQSAQFRAKMKKAAWIAITVAFFGGIIWLSMSGSGSGSKQESTVPNELLTIASDDYAVGPATAPVTLVEYLDFECEACGAYFPLVKQLEQEFPNDIRVVRRYFPLPGHKNGMTAALAVEAAARQGKYEEMHDLLFTEQKNWGEKPAPTPEVFEGYAQQIGLDLAKFKEDVTSQSVKDRVQRDFNSGNKLGNNGTPTFFLNGKKISNPNGFEPFKKLINDAIAASKTANGQ